LNAPSLLTNSAVMHTTTCKLCKKAIARMPALDIPVIGDPGRKAAELMKVLYKHLSNHHPEQLQEGAQLAARLQQEIPAFLILAAFQHEDPSMVSRMEGIRSIIFQLSRKNTMTDASLQHIIAGFGLDPDDESKVNEAFRALRDVLCEIGPFAPKIPQDSLIIPV
jgi:hypothetical protein